MTFTKSGIDAIKNKELLGAIKDKAQGMIKNNVFRTTKTAKRAQGDRTLLNHRTDPGECRVTVMKYWHPGRACGCNVLRARARSAERSGARPADAPALRMRNTFPHCFRTRHENGAGVASGAVPIRRR